MSTISYKAVKAEMLANNAELKNIYDSLEPEFELKKQLIQARINSKISQQQLAQKMNMKQSNLARFENSLNSKISTIIKYAKALGLKELKIALE